MQKIAITGANGTIGTVLQKGLSGYQITQLAKPQIDILDFQKVSQIIKGHDVIIHLAWDSSIDNYKSENINPDNSVMMFNIYQAAIEQHVPRIIMASSVHADRFDNWEDKELMSPLKTPVPDSPYGAHKVFMEALGRYYSAKGLEVICIRFGAVNQQDKPAIDFAPERAVYFSHKDCANLVKKIIDAPTFPNNFSIIYGVSDNVGRVQDISNPFGWTPVEEANTL